MNGIDILCDAAGSDMLNSLYSPPEVPKEPAQHPPQQLGKRKLSTSDTSPSSIHVCHICKRVYERADHLTRHLRSHENARPYQCSRCPKRFNRADLLTRHETTHDRDNAGKGRTFIRRSDRAAEACLNCAASKSKCEVNIGPTTLYPGHETDAYIGRQALLSLSLQEPAMRSCFQAHTSASVINRRYFNAV